MKTRVLGWWSGGVTSALACLWAVQTFKNVEIVFIDTKNESEDTERFLTECEQLYSVPITRTSNPKYQNIKEVWRKFLTLRTANGAICSTVLKREVRESFQNLSTDFAQVFGFDANEPHRHFNMRRNYPELNVISPLVDQKISKAEATRQMIKLGIKPPVMYRDFENNNCDKTGCVMGGEGYWKVRKEKRPDSYFEMAALEHELTDLKGQPVTILRDQTKARKGEPIFLEPHPNYPQFQHLAMKQNSRPPEPLPECHGFCETKETESI